MRVLLAVLLMAATAQGQVRGADALPAQAYSRVTCTRYVQSFRHKAVAHTAWLWNVFSTSRTCPRRFLKLANRGISVSIEVHPTCGPCRNRPSLYGPLRAPGDGRTIRQITTFANRHPEAVWLLSLELEDEFTHTEAINVRTTIQSIWPFSVVRNPKFGRDRAGCDYLELHGYTAHCTGPGEIADLDGSELAGSALRRWLAANSGCSFVRLWSCGGQGTCAGYRDVSDRSYSWPG